MFFDETWFYAPDLAPNAASYGVAHAAPHGMPAEGAKAGAALPSPAVFPEDEAHHAFQVLRLRDGDEILAADGCGSVYRASLHGDRKRARIAPLERVLASPQAPQAALALALLKGRDCEDPVAAACEMALSDVFLLRTDHAQVHAGQDHEKLLARLRQKSIVAMKQARKPHLTRIHPPLDLGTWLGQVADWSVITAHPGADTLPEKPVPPFVLLVGPEGGLSNAELSLLAESPRSYRLGLGETRLRAVHAPLVGLGKLLGRGWF